jgi:nicotinate-nucleotide--dimethylbenzimidazole phosphoribosyltransferase
MPEILTESFCERCGTRYTFESDAPAKTKRGIGRFKTTAKGLKNYVMSDETSLDEAMAAARSDDEREHTAHQLDAFHATFNFCMTCRQYTCGNCWNDVEGRCLTCAPHLGHEIMPAPFPELPVAAAAPIAIEAWPAADLAADEDEVAAAEAAPPDEIDAADRLDRLSATTDDVVPTWLAAAEADALAAAEAQAIVEAVDEPEIAALADEAIEPVAAVPEPDAAEGAVAAAAVAPDTTPEAMDEAPHEVAPATEEPPIAAIAEVAAAAAIVDAVEAEPAIEPVAEPPVEADDRAAAATLATAALLGRFRPGRSIDAELEAYEAAVAASEAAAAAKILGTQEAETGPEAAELPAPEAPEPLAPAAQAESVAVEPEPVAVEAEVAEPEPVAAQAEVPAEVAAIAADEAPVAAGREEPAVEPESIAAAAALAAAAEPEATPEPARTDVVEQPTWRIIAPDSTSAPTNGHAPDALPAAATALPAEPLPSEPPQWPSSPEWPQPNPALLNQRTVAPSAAMEALWAASARDVVAPAQGGPAGGVQSCNSCGLSLSANARFCRRCGTRQG